jgi:hypothetical protein
MSGIYIGTSAHVDTDDYEASYHDDGQLLLMAGPYQPCFVFRTRGDVEAFVKVLTDALELMPAEATA